MRIFDSYNRNIVAVMLVFIMIIFVYGATSALTHDAQAPVECNETYFTLKNVCFDNEKTAYNGFMSAVIADIENGDQTVNGFRVKLFGSKGIEPVIIFKTVDSHSTGRITAPFKDDVLGKIDRIEIEPVLNLNSEITYCSLKHGNVYEGKRSEC